MTSFLTVAISIEDLWSQIGFDSLDEIPWEAFPPALGLSAIIGAAGGFVYSGLSGNSTDKNDEDS